MKLPSKRMILVPPTTREDFIEYASSAGWTYRSEVQEVRDRFVPYELAYSDADGQTWLRYVDDFAAEMPYVVVAGHDYESVAELVSQGLPVYSDEDLLAWAEQATDSREVALSCRYVAVAAPAQRELRFFAALLRGLRHPDPAARVMCIRACAYPGWPELKPVLREIETVDPDPRVRDTAARMLAVFENASS